MKLRRIRQPKRGRIEIIPMIDVMFFLLVTFMLASLTMQHLNAVQVNLPQGAAAPMEKKPQVTLTVTPDSQLFLDKTPVTLDRLAPTLKTMLNPADPSVIIAADNAATNGVIVQAMIKAREAGAQHFLVAVQHGN
ncbi:MAG: biopolymer transporter ExbD [Hydrogenophilales bacterium CG_4_9_14_3_um_filter_63_34]|nr:MAG: biopolymer transporter ExbD [Hydrogenophilales bacterium CG_4_9_14_3_um_filter_63_34]